MNERFPSVPFVMFCVVGLFVTYQADDGTVASAPRIVSQTRVVPAIKWPHPVVGPAAPQSSPPGMPPWNMLMGRMNDCRSPPQPPLALDHGAPGCEQW